MHKLKPKFYAPLQQLLVQVPKTKTLILDMFILYMLKAVLISSWNEKQNTKGYLSTNKHSGFDLTLSFHNKFPLSTLYFMKYTFFYRKHFHKKMSLKNPETLRKC